jgi:hypothetical protein
MFPLPPRPMDTRCGGVTLDCSPLLLLLDVMAHYYFSGLSICPALLNYKKFSSDECYNREKVISTIKQPVV